MNRRRLGTSRPASSTDGSFAAAWRQSLVRGRPRIRFPRRGVRGLAVLAVSATVLAGIIAGTTVLSRSLSTLSFGSPDDQDGAQAAATSASGTPRPGTTQSTGPSTVVRTSTVPGGSVTKTVAAPPHWPDTRQVTDPETADPRTSKPAVTPTLAERSASPTTRPTSRPSSTPRPTSAVSQDTRKPAPSKPVAAKMKTGPLTGSDVPSGTTISIRAYNNQYVRAEYDLAEPLTGLLHATSPNVSSWTKFVVTWHANAQAWSLRSWRGQYVSAEVQGNGDDKGILRARAGSVDSWELFRIVRFDDGTYGFQSIVSGSYVSAELNDSGDRYAMLRARSGTVARWERFVVS